MSFRVVEREVSVGEFTVKGHKYRRVCTYLPKGKYVEYHLPEHSSIYTASSELKSFVEKPYLIFPEGDHFLLVVPRWLDLRAGWLIQQTSSYNVYRVDRYALWANLIPAELKGEFELEPRFNSLYISEGRYLSGSTTELGDAWTAYKNLLVREVPGRGFLIRDGKVFSLMSSLIRDGVIPYISRRVDVKERWRTDIELRPYQMEALQFWLQNGAMVLVWPYGAGKTYFSAKLIALVSGQTLIVCPSLDIVRIWIKYLKEHLTGPRIGEYTSEMKRWGDVVVSTYHSVLKDKERFKGPWKLCIIDEAHHLPADVYSKLAFLDMEFRVCLSGSPFRNDGRSELIYALGGQPYGHNWDELVAEGWVRKPEVHVHITEYKLSKARELLDRLPPRTLIFCDSINLGEEASRVFGIPFVHGAYPSRERERMLEENPRLICSRIFDEGIDIPSLRSAIELDFLYASLRQESQRAGRLMHAVTDGTEYWILISPVEFEKYGRRLQSLYARNFNIELTSD